MQIIAYLRVSTAKQGVSGLGLEAQRAAVASFAKAGNHVITAEYVEVESGSKAARPQLAAALTSCRLHRATRVIAKLDRLARNVDFIANLMDGGVEFVACDMPHANRLTLHLQDGCPGKGLGLDDGGNLLIDGLHSGPAADVDYPEARLRAESGAAEGIEWIGSGSAVDRA